MIINKTDTLDEMVNVPVFVEYECLAPFLKMFAVPKLQFLSKEN